MAPILLLPLDLLLVLAVLCASTGVGLWFIRRLSWTDSFFRMSIGCGVGLWMLCLLVFALVHLRLLNGVIPWIALCFFSVVGGSSFYRFLNVSIQKPHSVSRDPFTSLEKVLLGLFIFAAAAHLAFAYAPPTQTDELMYHIGLPRLYVLHGGFMDQRDNFASYYPLNAQMLYTLFFWMRGALLVKMSIWVLGLLVCGTFWYFMRRQMNLERPVALLVMLFLYTMPFMNSLQGVTNSDLLSLLFEVLAVCLFWSWRKEPDARHIVWMGILAGAGMGTRPYAIAWVLAIAMLLVFVERRFREPIIFLVAAFLVYLPWPLRTYLLTGNPFYPTALWPGAAEDIYFKGLSLTYKAPFWSFFWLPGFPLISHTVIWGIGPLVLALLPAGLLLGQRNAHHIRIAILAGLVVLLSYPFPLKAARYIGQAAPYLSILAGLGLFELVRQCSPKLSPWLKIWVLLSLLFPNLMMAAVFGAKRLPYLFGLESSERYLDREYEGEEHSSMMRYLQHSIPAGKTVLVMGPSVALGYYHPRLAFIGMSRFHPDLYTQPAPALAKALAARNIDYLMLIPEGFVVLSDGGFAYSAIPTLGLRLPPLKPPFFNTVHKTADAILFEIQVTSSPVSPR